MAIDVNEGEINGDMKGRDFSSLLQSVTRDWEGDSQESKVGVFEERPRRSQNPDRTPQVTNF
jgi:hypothetical protein